MHSNLTVSRVQHPSQSLYRLKETRDAIIIADDQAICLETIRTSLVKTGLQSQCTYLQSGSDAITTAIQLVKTKIEYLDDFSQSSGQLKIKTRPIALMILDMQMPGATGIEVIKRLKQVYDHFQMRSNHLVLIEPVFVIMTAFNTQQLRQLLK